MANALMLLSTFLFIFVIALCKLDIPDLLDKINRKIPGHDFAGIKTLLPLKLLRFFHIK